jgi:hypothetical protein
VIFKTGKFTDKPEGVLKVKNLGEVIIYPSNQDIFNVKRVLYCPGRSLTYSDIVKAR